MKAWFFPNMIAIVAVAGVCSASQAFVQDTTPPKMPHTVVENPECIQASQASFFADDDVLIGISHGDVSRTLTDSACKIRSRVRN